MPAPDDDAPVVGVVVVCIVVVQVVVVNVVAEVVVVVFVEREEHEVVSKCADGYAVMVVLAQGRGWVVGWVGESGYIRARTRVQRTSTSGAHVHVCMLADAARKRK